MAYEIGLVDMYDGPAREKKGPYLSVEEAAKACGEGNKKLYGVEDVSPYKYPQWMWARVGEIPLKAKE